MKKKKKKKKDLTELMEQELVDGKDPQDDEKENGKFAIDVLNI